jgi:ABC-type nitrate/sulfonate/bicarbonate transport system substrate-binding protein
MSAAARASKRLAPLLLAAAGAVIVALLALHLVRGRSASHLAATRQKLAVGVLPDGASDLVYLAAALGYFEDEGLDVELWPYDRGWAGISALADHRVDVAIADDVSLVTESFARRNYVLFATIGHADARSYVVARKDRGITSAADLRGKRLGVEPRMSARYLTDRLLAAHGLEDGGVEIVETARKKLPDALLHGDVDAVVDPLAYDAPSARRMAGDSGVELVVMADRGSHRLSFEALASHALATKNPAALRVFVHALLRALDHVRDHPEEAERALEGALGAEGTREARSSRHVVLEVSLERGMLDTLDEIERWARASNHLHGQQPPLAGMIDEGPLRAERPAAVTLPAAVP